MMIDGKDVRSESLERRRSRLEQLLAGADQDLLRLSEAFDDPEKLLAAALELGLEGIVSKRREQPYRSGPNSGWVKVKTAAWREANRGRWEMFERWSST
jgi:bifunctional non-homologous end joining protein LigD